MLGKSPIVETQRTSVNKIKVLNMLEVVSYYIQVTLIEKVKL